MEVIRNLLPPPRLDPVLVGQMEALFRQHSRGLSPAPSDVAAARTRFLNSMRAEASLAAASGAAATSSPVHPRLALQRILQSSVRPAVATGAIVLFASTGVAHAAGLDPLHQVAKFVQAPVELVLSGVGLGDSDESDSGARNGSENSGGQNSGGQGSGAQGSGSQDQGGPADAGPGNAPAAVPGNPNEESAPPSEDMKPGPNGTPQGVAVGIDGNTEDAPGQTGETPPENVPRSEAAQPGRWTDDERPAGAVVPAGQGDPLPAETLDDGTGGTSTTGTDGAGERAEPTDESAAAQGGTSSGGNGTAPGVPSEPPEGNPGQGPGNAPETPSGLEENPGQGSEHAPDTPVGLQPDGDDEEDDEGVTAPPSTASPDPASITPGHQGQGNANGLDPSNPGQGHSDTPSSGSNGDGASNGNPHDNGNDNSDNGQPATGQS